MIENLTKALVDAINYLPEEEKIEALNYARQSLHEISPFKNEPCDLVVWVKSEDVYSNNYNPNYVATPEMRLLHTSILLDGVTMPIVTYKLDSRKREIVDGFHRNKTGREGDIKRRLKGYLPVSTIDKPSDERMASTIRHNRARGTHGIRPMSDIVLELTKMGWDDVKICEQLGMDLDEVIRLKQITGLKEAFMGHEFSKSWDEFKRKYFKEDLGNE